VGSPDYNDQSDRHQRLLQEFTKLKAQHSALTSTMTHERRSHIDLLAAMKKKEHDGQRMSLEVDNLKFHNQRLLKRLEQLQKDINDASSATRNSWLLGSVSVSGAYKAEMARMKEALAISTQELASMINQNEMLHKELADLRLMNGRAEYLALQEQLVAKDAELETIKQEFTKSAFMSNERIKRLEEQYSLLSSENDLLKDHASQRSQDANTAHTVLSDSSVAPVSPIHIDHVSVIISNVPLNVWKQLVEFIGGLGRSLLLSTNANIRRIADTLHHLGNELSSLQKHLTTDGAIKVCFTEKIADSGVQLSNHLAEFILLVYAEISTEATIPNINDTFLQTKYDLQLLSTLLAALNNGNSSVYYDLEQLLSRVHQELLCNSNYCIYVVF
jgi:hypothetical protein